MTRSYSLFASLQCNTPSAFVRALSVEQYDSIRTLFNAQSRLIYFLVTAFLLQRFENDQISLQKGTPSNSTPGIDMYHFRF
mmetsp:Transcript_21936/g.52204  ORF Transcript_21936/g.52204 Transcript_21936/m.52204 type:complete len:81 (-) Transcript_21936:232-474(-)